MLNMDPLGTNLQNGTKEVDSLLNFYYNYGENWELYLKNEIKSLIKDTSIEFSLLDIFQNRTNFKYTLKIRINSLLKNKTYDILSLYNLQIFNINFPEGFEKSVESKLTQSQNNNAKIVEGELEIIKKNTERITKQNDEDIKLIQADALTYKEKMKYLSLINCTQIDYKTDIESYSEMNNSLELNKESTSDLINFINIFENKFFNK